MKKLSKILLAGLFLVSSAAFAADPPTISNVAVPNAYYDANGVKQFVDPTHPLPVTGGTGGGGTANPYPGSDYAKDHTDYFKAGGAISNTSFASTQSGAWSVGLTAGTAVVGKFGIDPAGNAITGAVTATGPVAVGQTQTGAPVPISGLDTGGLARSPLLDTAGRITVIGASSAGTSFASAMTVQGNVNSIPVLAAEAGSVAATAGITPNVTQSGTAVLGKSSGGNLYSAYAALTAAASAQTWLVTINATAVPASGAAITPVDVAAFSTNAVGAVASTNYGAGPPNVYSAGIVLLVTTSLTTYTPGAASFIQSRVR